MVLLVAGDAGVEYTTGKTTNGTAGSSGAYVQFDFSAILLYLLNFSGMIVEMLVMAVLTHG